MGITVHHKTHSFPANSHTKPWKEFIDWCDRQEENKLGWLGASFLVHGCIFVPMTIGIIAMSGNNFYFVAIVLAGMITAISVNLTMVSSKISIPVFFFTLLIDLMIIVDRLFHGINIQSYFNR